MESPLAPKEDTQALRRGSDALYPKIRYDTSPPSSFWTGGSPSRRPGSVHSLSSSMNSSLHGYPTFDPQEQDPVFTNSCQRSTSSNFGTTFPGLPPPPVELDQTTAFDCDICGKSINVRRRLEWQ